MRRQLVLLIAGAALIASAAPIYGQYPPYPYAPAMMPGPNMRYGPPMQYVQRPPMMYQAQPMPYVPRPQMVYQPSPTQFLPPPPRPYQPVPARVEDVRPLPETYIEIPTITTQSAVPTTPPPVTTYVGGNQRHSFSAGASYLLVKPYFGNNAAFTTRTFVTTTPTDRNSDFSWEMRPAVAAWASYTGPRGLGVRGNFFLFDQSSTNANATLTPAQAAAATNILPPSNLVALAGNANITFRSPGVILGTAAAGTDVLSFSSNLSVYFVDFEATKSASWADLALLFSGGGRFLRMNQDYRANLSNSFLTASETQNLSFTHTFEGAGPTVATDVRLPVGMVSGLSLFGNFRGSLLLGRFSQSANFSQVIVDPNVIVGGSATTNTGNSISRDSVMPITEIEFGAEYIVRVGRLQPTLRASVVNQTYFGAGSASQADGNLSLFGARLSWGVVY